MGKSDGEISDDLDEIVDNIRQDRERLSEYLDELIKTIKTSASDGENGLVVMAADSVAKIGDSLMKNNQLRVNVANLIVKTRLAEEDQDADVDELGVAIGSPFAHKHEEDGGDN